MQNCLKLCGITNNCQKLPEITRKCRNLCETARHYSKSHEIVIYHLFLFETIRFPYDFITVFSELRACAILRTKKWTRRALLSRAKVDPAAACAALKLTKVATPRRALLLRAKGGPAAGCAALERTSKTTAKNNKNKGRFPKS